MVKVFISWSGERARRVGHAVKAYLDVTFASHVSTFLSDADVAAGVRFMTAIGTNLDEADLGVVVVTRTNQRAPWLLFEVGALAAKSSMGNVIPLLVDLERKELESPLNQFQNVLGASRQSVDKLSDRIWQELDRLPGESTYKMLRESAWPGLEEALRTEGHSPSVDESVRRQPDEVLNEILLGVNALIRRDVALEESPGSHASTESRVRNNGDLRLASGDIIRHAEFGVGTVTAVTGSGARAIAHVQFFEGPKKLLIRIAPIALLGKEGTSDPAVTQ